MSATPERVLTMPMSVYHTADKHYREAQQYGDGLISMADYLQGCRDHSAAIAAHVAARVAKERERILLICDEESADVDSTMYRAAANRIADRIRMEAR